MEQATVNSNFSSLRILTAIICALGMSVKTPVDAHGNQFNVSSLACDAWSCRNNMYWKASNIRGYFRDMGCFCDRYCDSFDDCCFDYNTTSNSDKTHSAKGMKQFMGCCDEHAVAKENGFLAVVSCPDEWHGSDMNSLCTSDNTSDVMLRLPVTGNVSGLVYRNVYCALCHREPYLYWRPKVACDSKTPLNLGDNSTMDEVLKNPLCHLKFLPPVQKGLYRPCMSDIINTCALDYNNTQIVDACRYNDDMQLVYSLTGLVFKNVECALCNFERPYCTNMMQFDMVHVTRSRSLYSFSILLDLNTRSGSTNVGTRFRKVQKRVNITHTCDLHQVYDPFIQACRDVYDLTVSDIHLNLDVSQDYGIIGVYRPLNSTSDCPRIRLNESEFNILGDSSLQTLSGHVYRASQYHFDGVFAYVCTNLTQNYTETTTLFDTKIEFNFSVTTAIITSIGLFLSLLGLLVTMTVYFSFKTLRNIPGKILLSLTSSLFFAEGILLFASQVEEIPILCKLFAILMHYLFLESFLWMNVMAGDVWFTFSKSFVKAGDRGKSSKRFYFYSVYVRCVAIVLVTSAIIVDNVLHDSQFRPNYGAGLCWFTNKRGLLVFFAAPVFLILLMNLVFFSVAARSIYIAKRKSAVYLAKPDNAQFSIYAKLAFVMGLTWIFGFLASVFPFPAMWYIYIIFNTLQGLFICIGFVFTRKVLSLVRERFHSLGRRSSASDQMPSSPTRSTELTFRVGDRIR